MLLTEKKGILSLATAMALAGWSNSLFGQQEFFSPISIQKQVVSSYKHDYISIVHGPGQVKFEMPLAPGLEARGLSYRPVFRMHPSQKTMANITGGGSWHSELYMGFGEWVLIGGIASSTGKNNLWFNNKGATTIYAQPSPGDQPGTVLCQNFNQDPSSIHMIDPGYIASHYDDWGLKVIILPTGETLSVASRQNALEVNSETYKPLLQKFGIPGQNLTSMKAFRVDPDAIIIPMTNEDGSNPDVIDVSNRTCKTAGRYVVLKSGIAYVYEYKGPFDVSTIPAEYADGDMVTPQRTYYDLSPCNSPMANCRMYNTHAGLP